MQLARSFAAVLPLFLVACASAPQQEEAVTPRQPAPASAASASSADWPTYNGSLEGTRYSAFTQLTPATAARLQRACTFLLHGISPSPMRVTWSVPVTTRENVDARLTHERAMRFCPGTQGGTEWNGPAYDPQRNLLFAGAVDWCTSIRLVHPDSVPDPLPNDFTGHKDGGFGDFDPQAQWRGWITATDADAGEIRWRHETETPILAGVTATAGGVVMTGDMEGRLVAGGTISPIWPLPPATSRVTSFRLP